MNVLELTLIILLSPFIVFAAIIALCLLIYLIILLFEMICTPFVLAANGIQSLWYKMKSKFTERH